MYGTAMMGLLGGGGGQLFEDFQYTGTGSSGLSVTTGINTNSGGLIWVKKNLSGTNHVLFDTVRGANKALYPNTTAISGTLSGSLTAFSAIGFTVGTNSLVNSSPNSFNSFSWKEEPLFMDIVTYTGNATNRTIAHNLGVAPKLIIVKDTTDTGHSWAVYHASNTASPETDYLLLNATDATADDNTFWNDTAPTSSVFSVGTNGNVNANSQTFVAYLFAEKAGKSKMGSYTGTGASNAITGLGFTPKMVMIKRTDAAGDWSLNYIQPSSGTTSQTVIDTSGRGATSSTLDSNGFTLDSTANINTNGATYIYAAWG